MSIYPHFLLSFNKKRDSFEKKEQPDAALPLDDLLEFESSSEADDDLASTTSHVHHPPNQDIRLQFLNLYQKQLKHEWFSFFRNPGIRTDMSLAQIIGHGLGHSCRQSQGKLFTGQRTHAILKKMGLIYLNANTNTWDITDDALDLILQEREEAALQNGNALSGQQLENTFKIPFNHETFNQRLEIKLQERKTFQEQKAIKEYWSDNCCV